MIANKTIKAFRVNSSAFRPFDSCATRNAFLLVPWCKMTGDWLKLHRKIADSVVMSDDWLCRLWISCLVKTNWKIGYFKGQKIEPGQFAFSYRVWSESLAVSHGKLKRGLKKLCDEEIITLKSGTLFSVVTLCNWTTYQDDLAEDGTQTERKRNADEHTNGTPVNTDRRREERKKAKKEEVSVDNEVDRRPKSAKEFCIRWNAFVADKPRLKKVRFNRETGEPSGKLKKHINSRLKEKGWYSDFREAIQLLPLARCADGSDWQPDLHYLTRNESNVSELLEGKFDWRVGSEAERRLEKRKRTLAAELREQLEAENKESRKCDVNGTRQAIESTLNQTTGNSVQNDESDLLSGLMDE